MKGQVTVPIKSITYPNVDYLRSVYLDGSITFVLNNRLCPLVIGKDKYLINANASIANFEVI